MHFYFRLYFILVLDSAKRDLSKVQYYLKLLSNAAIRTIFWLGVFYNIASS